MITSTSNAQVKQIVQLQKKGKLRNELGLYLVEGFRMYREVPKRRLQKVYVSESFYLKKKDQVGTPDMPVEVLSDHVFAHVSDTKTPQGILCLVEQEHYQLTDLLGGKTPFLLVLDNLQDPGNLGTIFRTAEAAGVSGIVMSKDCVDIYNPKTIRSTMGSIYRMPYLYAENLEQKLGELKKQKIRMYAAHLEGSMDYDRSDYRKPSAFLIGNEGNGLREEIAAMADIRIRIPMHGQVESLNAAIASSVLMFETARQRREL